MPYQREALLIDRCAGYLHELAEIYSSGGTDNRHILRDLEEIERRAGRVATNTPSLRPAAAPCAERIRWVDDIGEALARLGGKAHLSKIEGAVRRLRIDAGRSWPKNADACIRYTLETHCADSLNYRGGPNLFEMVDRGSGYWRLNMRTP